MIILPDEYFICQNCKTPLCNKSHRRWVLSGEEPACHECTGEVFDMYNSGLREFPAPKPID